MTDLIKLAGRMSLGFALLTACNLVAADQPKFPNQAKSPSHPTAVDQKSSLNQNLDQKAAAINAAKAWLSLVDNQRYGDSWSAGSVLLQRTVTKEEWEKILNAVRKPLGGARTRTLIEELPAQNPKKMPKGDYMVILYDTAFSSKSSAKELLTLSYEHGSWRVITYNVE